MGKYCLYINFFLVINVLLSCDKYDLERNNPHDMEGTLAPVVVTSLTTSSPAKTIQMKGTLKNFGGDAKTVTDHGFCYSRVNKTPTIISDGKLTLGAKSTLGDFSYSYINLTTGYIYYYRAYATNKYVTSYGAVIEVTVK